VTTATDRVPPGPVTTARPQTLLLTLLGSTALDRDVAIFSGSFVTVMNRDVTVWQHNTPHPRQLADHADLRTLLVEHFGFDLPEVERMRAPSIPEWS